MAVYEVTGPNGEVYEIEGPDDADPSAVIAQITGMQTQAAAPADESGPSLLMAPVGGAELLAMGATGLLAQVPAGLAGLGTMAGRALGLTQADPADVVRDIEERLTYVPRSESAQSGLAAIARGVEAVERAVNPALAAIGRVSPTAENVVRTVVPAGLEALATVAPLARVPGTVARTAAKVTPAVPSALEITRDIVRPVTPQPPRGPAPPTAEQIVSRMDTQQSMGAAAAAPSLVNVSPELRQAIVQSAQRTGGAINPEALNRHIEADTLPVRMRLTEGQATQDPVLISHEMNSRLKNPELAAHFDTQNKQLAQNLQAIRDEVGPDVFSANPVEHGDTLIAAYRAKNEAAQAQITALYDRLRQAAGGNFPVDANQLLARASQNLHKQLLYEHAPSSIMRQLNRFAEQGMTFEQFEALRTNLATIQRSHTSSGLERRAAGVIREAMEQLPLKEGAAKLKPLADEARAAARAQFEALEADPAYKAAVQETISPDAFVRKFLVGGTRDNVAKMRENLADDPTAIQTMGVAVLDHLREVARLNPHYEGNFAAASFNKALTGLSPKLRSLLPPRVAEQLEQLGNVARYTTAQPRGSAVNNSNTFVASAAEHAAQAVEGAVNVGAAGIPVGTWTREALARRRQRQELRRAIAPGAGLDRLPETRQ